MGLKEWISLIIMAIIGIVIIAGIGSYLANNPQILENLEDAVMVICGIDDRLVEELADAGINQSDINMIMAMVRGMEVQAGDVRSLNERIKDKVAKPIPWNDICNAVGL